MQYFVWYYQTMANFMLILIKNHTYAIVAVSFPNIMPYCKVDLQANEQMAHTQIN